MDIKFRGKALVNDKHNGIKVNDWVYGCFINTRVDAPAIVWGDGEQMEVDLKTVGQYIRFNDIESREIYHGDIVKCKSKHQGLVATHIVDISNMLAPFPFSLNLGIEGKTYCDFYSSYQVIGNIHDNPELKPAR